MANAHSSTQSRKELLKHSLVFTIQHPLFGVGPGMFAVADDIYEKASGAKKGSWLGTHNSYTQVSSEIGIPAFLFFVAAIWMALKGPYSIYQKTRGDPRLDEMGTIAMGLHYCLVIYAVTILFEHIAYTIMLPAFGGLAASMVRTATVEIQRIQATPPAGQHVPRDVPQLSGYASQAGTGGRAFGGADREWNFFDLVKLDEEFEKVRIALCLTTCIQGRNQGPIMGPLCQ